MCNLSIFFWWYLWNALLDSAFVPFLFKNPSSSWNIPVHLLSHVQVSHYRKLCQIVKLQQQSHNLITWSNTLLFETYTTLAFIIIIFHFLRDKNWCEQSPRASLQPNIKKKQYPRSCNQPYNSNAILFAVMQYSVRHY